MQPRCRLIGFTLRATAIGERTTVDGLAERNEDITGGLAAALAPTCKGLESVLILPLLIASIFPKHL